MPPEERSLGVGHSQIAILTGSSPSLLQEYLRAEVMAPGRRDATTRRASSSIRARFTATWAHMIMNICRTHRSHGAARRTRAGVRKDMGGRGGRRRSCVARPRALPVWTPHQAAHLLPVVGRVTVRDSIPRGSQISRNDILVAQVGTDILGSPTKFFIPALAWPGHRQTYLGGPLAELPRIPPGSAGRRVE